MMATAPSLLHETTIDTTAIENWTPKRCKSAARYTHTATCCATSQACNTGVSSSDVEKKMHHLVTAQAFVLVIWGDVTENKPMSLQAVKHDTLPETAAAKMDDEK